MKESKKPPIRLSLSKSVFEVSIDWTGGYEQLRIQGLADDATPTPREEELVRKYLVAEGFTKISNQRID